LSWVETQKRSAMDEVKISKFMSLVLRHEPQALGVTLDQNGWTDFGVFAEKMNSKFDVSEAELKRLIATNPKQRFILENGRVRANQGHSLNVDLALEATTPPDVLFHGTTQSAWASIKTQGLLKQDRQHVHLSKDVETAEIVAKRRKGPWIILAVDAKTMHTTQQFFLSANAVWLVESVPQEHIRIQKELGTL
jgi:putative RNA 2'-phosphotransferase